MAVIAQGVKAQRACVEVGDTCRKKAIVLMRAWPSIVPHPPDNERGRKRWELQKEDVGRRLREAYDLLQDAHLRYLQAGSLGDTGLTSLGVRCLTLSRVACHVSVLRLGSHLSSQIGRRVVGACCTAFGLWSDACFHQALW